MKVIYGIGGVKKPLKNAVMAIGVFDGLHKGHQALIKTAVKKARALKGKAVVMTFYPHPVHVLNPHIYKPLIISLNQRIKFIENLGVDVSIVIKFTKSFSRLTPEQFVKKYILKYIKPKEIIVGDDFRFGQDRGGTLDVFKMLGENLGFCVSSVKCIGGKKQKIGSTAIRDLIMQGSLSRVKNLLGRNVVVEGEVVKGDSRGSLLGYPTANIQLDEKIIVPPGVFAVSLNYRNRIYSGMANVGKKPTFKKSDRISIEVHIFDFNRQIYGKRIIIEFLKKFRDEKVFDSQEAIVEHLKKDEIQIRKYFKI